MGENSYLVFISSPQFPICWLCFLWWWQSEENRTGLIQFPCTHGDDLHVWIWGRWLMLIHLTHLVYVVKGLRWCSYRRPKNGAFSFIETALRGSLESFLIDLYSRLLWHYCLRTLDEWNRFLRDKLILGLWLIWLRVEEEMMKSISDTNSISCLAFVSFLFSHSAEENHNIINVLSGNKGVSAVICVSYMPHSVNETASSHALHFVYIISIYLHVFILWYL